MKSLIVYPFDPATGVGGRKSDAARVFEELHRSASISFDTLFLDSFSSAGSSAKERQASSRTKLFDVATRNLSLIKRLVATVVSTRKVIKYSKPTVIMIYGLNVWPIIAGVAIATYHRIPYVLYEHRTTYAYLRETGGRPSLFLRYAIRNASGVACLARLHRDDLLHFFPKADVSVLPISIPAQGISAVEEAECVNDRAEFTLGAWTNWRGFKRLDLLIEAFLIFRESVSAAKLVVAGPIPPSAENERASGLLMECRVKDDVDFVGELDRKQIYQLARSVDVVVVPSDCESFGLPTIEALWHGTPVIATKCGGPEDLISEGENGFLVDVGSCEELANAMRRAFLNQSQFDKATIRERARDRFSVSRQVDELVDLYAKSAAGRG